MPFSKSAPYSPHICESDAEKELLEHGFPEKRLEHKRPFGLLRQDEDIGPPQAQQLNQLRTIDCDAVGHACLVVRSVAHKTPSLGTLQNLLGSLEAHWKK